MSIPKKHHFLPVFYLQQWAKKAGKVVEWRKRGAEVKPYSLAPRGTGYKEGLYSIVTDIPNGEQSVETDVMRDQIDTPADLIASKLLSIGPKSLTYDERIIWTRFVMSLKPRSEAAVRILKEKVPGKLLDILRIDNQKNYERFKLDDTSGIHFPDTAAEFLTTYMPRYLDNAGIHVMLASMSNDNFIRQICDLHWAVIEIQNGNFLTGDHLPIVVGPSDSDNWTLSMPLSPKKLFVAARDTRTIRNMRRATLDGSLVRILNKDIATRSHDVIYSVDEKQFQIITANFTGTRPSDIFKESS